MANIFILGAGSFGTSLAIISSDMGHNVTLWARNCEKVSILNETKVNKLLPFAKIQDNVNITTELTNLKNCDIAIIATASHAVREICQMIANIINPNAIIVCVAKGFEGSSLKRMSQVMGEELKNTSVILSGPSHAEELAKYIPTAIVAASSNRSAAEFVQDTLSNKTLRIYVNDDVIGVELGAALKNVIALAAGALDGIGLGDNTKAALITRGMIEISRLGIACGAKAETFTGLSGIGDLIVTCTSAHSRNNRAGLLIGQGKTIDEAIAEIGMTVEGYKNAKSAYELSLKYNIDMPIITQVYKILYENKPIAQAITDLMGRPKRHESEVVWSLNK